MAVNGNPNENKPRYRNFKFNDQEILLMESHKFGYGLQ